MNKQQLKEFLVDREKETLRRFESDLNSFIGDTQIDYQETREEDDYSHHHQSTEASNAAHAHLHEHTNHLKTLQTLAFSDSREVEPGAVVQVNDRYMVVAMAETAFEFDGKKFLSISTASPIYQCMKGKKEGDSCSFNGHDFVINTIY